MGERAFDSFLAEEALELVLAAAVGADREGAIQVLRGDETTWARVLDAARTRSLFSDRRAVVVRDADALRGEPEGLEDYLGDPTPGVTLVLVAPKPDKRRAVWKRVLDRASVVKAEPLKGQALRAYVMKEVRRRGIALGQDGLEELVERVGQDLRRVMGELDKLEAFGQGTQALSVDDVAAVLGKGLARPLYRLGDAFVAWRPAEVLELMEESLEEGEAPLRVLATLHRVVRQLRGARALRDARVPREEMAARLGVPPFKLGDLLAAERQWSEPELRAALEALGRADRRMKTGMNPRVALAAAVVEACGGRGEARLAPRAGR